MRRHTTMVLVATVVTACASLVALDPLSETSAAVAVSSDRAGYALREALGLESSGPTVATPASRSSQSPDPTGPITITQGGTYVGHWVSTSATPAIRVDTTDPVTIRDSLVENYGTGVLIHAEPGSQVTIERVTGKGGVGRFFLGDTVKSATIRNNTLDKTAGIYFAWAQPDATIVVTRNKQRNLQTPPNLEYSSFCQFDKVSTAAIEVSWNEVINTFGQSETTGDMISFFASSNGKIHDNYLQGGYPDNVGDGHSGSGIIVGDYSGGNNEVWNNQVVAITNVGIAIVGGSSNKVHDNRLVSDGKLDDGTTLAAANLGLVVRDFYDDANWGANEAWNNEIGWVNAGGARHDAWLPDCAGRCSNIALNRRQRARVTRFDELKEYGLWRAKLAATRTQVGAHAP